MDCDLAKWRKDREALEKTRDVLIIRAYLQEWTAYRIAKQMGIGQTTALRVIRAWEDSQPDE